MDEKVRPAGGYTPKQQRLHWIVAGLVVVQLALGSVIATTLPADHRGIMLLHAAVGTAIFLLMLSRWQLRQRIGAPQPPPGTPVDAAALARANHLGYYALLLTMPPIGWCAYMFGGGFGALHVAGAGVLVLAIAAHLTGIAYHAWIRHDGLVQRMLPRNQKATPVTEES